MTAALSPVARAWRATCGVLAAALWLLSCAAQAGAAGTPDAGQVWRDGQARYLAWNGHRAGWRVTESGLQYRRPLIRASGSRPRPGCKVTVNYEGRLIDGTMFDSSWARGKPSAFRLDQVIGGWREGVAMMRVGETWRFAIPPALAYGDRAIGPRKAGEPYIIPPGSALVFKVQLVGIEAACGVPAAP